MIIFFTISFYVFKKVFQVFTKSLTMNKARGLNPWVLQMNYAITKTIMTISTYLYIALIT